MSVLGQQKRPKKPNKVFMSKYAMKKRLKSLRAKMAQEPLSDAELRQMRAMERAKHRGKDDKKQYTVILDKEGNP